MSFQFNWPTFDNMFYNEIKSHLESGLNKKHNPKYIADYISVKEIYFGSSPPELEILEICELSTDYFRGIFKLTYKGDAFVTLKTKIQANPLYNPPSLTISASPFITKHIKTRMVAAHQPLFIPMQLGISDIILNGIITLSISKTKGITLVFKNDPLIQLKVNSTFDIIATIKSFLQKEIEYQLRLFLQDTFPIIVHDFSIRQLNDLQNKQTTNINLSSTTTTSIELQNNQLYDYNYLSDFNLNNIKSNNNNDADDDYNNNNSNIMTPGLCSPTPSFSETSSISSHLNDDDDLLFVSTSALYALNNNNHKKSSAQICINHMDAFADNDINTHTHFNLDDDNDNSNNNIYYDNPSMITLSTNNILNRMIELSEISNSLAYLCNNTNNNNNDKPTNYIIHKNFKPTIITSSSSLTTLKAKRHGKKIPKRRIWYL